MIYTILRKPRLCHSQSNGLDGTNKFKILIKLSHYGSSWHIIKQPEKVPSFGGSLFTLSFTCGWFKFSFQFHSVVSESLELILWVSAFTVLLAGNKKKHN